MRNALRLLLLSHKLTWMYLLRDEFSDDRAAGAVNGTASDSGHTREVTDTGSRVSIAGGALTVASGGPTVDPKLFYSSPLTRTPGLVLATLYRCSAINYDVLTLSADKSTVGNSSLYLYGGNLRNPEDNVNWGTYVINTDYRLYIALRAAGAFSFVKTGAGYPLLGWISAAGAVSALYAGIRSGNPGAAYTLADFRIAGYWLPVPLISDGFSTNGVSDGLGHTETSGIGSGGSGVSWSNVGGGWSVSGGKAINTPVAGSELIINGDCEIDANWTSVGSPSTNVRSTEQAHAGTYSRKWVGVSTADGVKSSTYTVADGDWISVTAWIFGSTGLSLIRLQNGNGANIGNSLLADTAGWNKYTLVTRMTVAGSGAYFQSYQNGGTAATRYVDDVSVKKLTLSDLISLHTSSAPDVFAGINLVVTAGTQAGLALNWDSSSSPANGVIAYHDGINAKLEKCVAGVWTTVVSAAATHSANARLVVSKIGTGYRLYYNNALVGSGAISDAGIINNTLHGLFSTYDGNRLDNYTCYASGSNGEYAILGTI